MAYKVKRLLNIPEWESYWAEEQEQNDILVWQHRPSGFDRLIFRLILDPDINYIVLGAEGDAAPRREIEGNYVGGETWEGPQKSKFTKESLPSRFHRALEFFSQWHETVIKQR